MDTGISWLGKKGETWNPLTGCTKVSPACDNCYAERMAKRQRAMGTRGYERATDASGWTGEITLLSDKLDIPLHWKTPRTIFVQSMGDLFHQGVPFEYIDRVFATMIRCQQDTFILCTKRAERMYEYMTLRMHPGRIQDSHILSGGLQMWGESDVPTWPLKNVIGMVTVESPDYLWRVEELLKTPFAARWVSCEPMLAGVDFTRVYSDDDDLGVAYDALRGCLHGQDPIDEGGPKLDGVIVGGENGPGARQMTPDWVRKIRDDCESAGVKFHFKGWGSNPSPEALGQPGCAHSRRHPGRTLDGRTHNDMPGSK